MLKPVEMKVEIRPWPVLMRLDRRLILTGG